MRAIAVPGVPTAWTRFDTWNDVDKRAVVVFIDEDRGIDHHTCPVEELPRD